MSSNENISAAEAFETIKKGYLRSLASLALSRYGFGVFDFLAGLEQSGRNHFADAFAAMGMPEALAAKMQFYPLVLKAELMADPVASYFFTLIVKEAQANRDLDMEIVDAGNEILEAANAERRAAQERHPSTNTDDGVVTAENPFQGNVEFETPFSGTVIAHSDEEASASFKAEYSERTGLPVDAIKVVIMGDDGQISGDTDAANELGLSLDDIMKRFG